MWTNISFEYFALRKNTEPADILKEHHLQVVQLEINNLPDA
jgi:hypothetical protein